MRALFGIESVKVDNLQSVRRLPATGYRRDKRTCFSDGPSVLLQLFRLLLFGWTFLQHARRVAPDQPILYQLDDFVMTFSPQ